MLFVGNSACWGLRVRGSHFLNEAEPISFFALGAGLGATSVSGAEQDTPDSLSGWAAKYRFTVVDNRNVVSMDGRMSNDQLAKGLQELAQLADSPMRADGNHLLGASGERLFQVLLRQR